MKSLDIMTFSLAKKPEPGSEDYCYMVPVVGKLLACGDCILQGEERRFNPIGELPEYTLKVRPMVGWEMKDKR